MSTNTLEKTASEEEPDMPIPTDSAIEHARKFVITEKAKIRAGGKMTINTSTMEVCTWPTIEIWCTKRRQYLPLSIEKIWRYKTSEARDKVLAALKK